MHKEPEEGAFPEGWSDADDEAMFAAAEEFVALNRSVIRVHKQDSLAQNCFIEGFIAGYEYHSARSCALYGKESGKGS